MGHNNKQIFILSLFITFVFAISFSADLYAGDKVLASNIDQGLAEFKDEKYEEAMEFFLKAMEQEPASATAAYHLGLTYKQLGNYNEAAKYLLEAVTNKSPIIEASLELADAYYNLDDLKKAGEWIGKAEKEGIKPAETAFLKGLILMKEGDNESAITAFTKAKETDKSLTQAATFQIAIAYANDRRLKEAGESFRAVITVDPATDIASYAKEYETFIARSIEAHKTWRLTASAAYQYDDNVVLKPSTAIPALEITGEKDSGIAANLRLDYTPLLSGKWLFNGQYSINTTTYFDTNSHNLFVHNMTLMPGYNIKRGAITLPLTYTYALVHEEAYMTVASARPTLNLQFKSGDIGQLTLGYAKRTMQQPALDPDEDRDGDIYSASAGYVHTFDQNRGVINARYELSREQTAGRNWDNIGNKLNFGALIPLKERLRLTVSGEAYWQDYKYTNTAFEIKRADRTYTGAVAVLWNIYKAIELNIQYSYTKANSNIAVYDYNRNVYTVGMECSF